MEIKIDDVSPEVDTGRTVLGHWPILLSILVATMTVVPLFGLFSSSRDGLQDASMRRAGFALIPIAVLIGLSCLIARYLPQTAAKSWMTHIAMWASFAAVLCIAGAAANAL